MFYSEAFIAYIKYEKRYALHTATAYEADLLQFTTYAGEAFGLTGVEEVRHTHVRSWLAGLSEAGAGATTLNRKISTLRSYFRYLLREQKVAVSPMDKVIAPKRPSRLPQFLQQETAIAMLNGLHSDTFTGFTQKLILELLYQAGLRRSELVTLRLGQVDFGKRLLKVWGKGGKERVVPFTVQLETLLRAYIEARNALQPEHEFLLVLESGKAIYSEFVYRTVKFALKDEPVAQKSPHVLRHSFATHLVDNGAELNAVKDLLGHSSLAATQVYTHSSIEALKEAFRNAHPKAHRKDR